MIIGIWVIDEVKKVVEKEYILDKFFEVWYFECIF